MEVCGRRSDAVRGEGLGLGLGWIRIPEASRGSNKKEPGRHTAPRRVMTSQTASINNRSNGAGSLTLFLFFLFFRYVDIRVYVPISLLTNLRLLFVFKNVRQ